MGPHPRSHCIHQHLRCGLGDCAPRRHACRGTRGRRRASCGRQGSRGPQGSPWGSRRARCAARGWRCRRAGERYSAHDNAVQPSMLPTPKSCSACRPPGLGSLAAGSLAPLCTTRRRGALRRPVAAAQLAARPSPCRACMQGRHHARHAAHPPPAHDNTWSTAPPACCMMKPASSSQPSTVPLSAMGMCRRPSGTPGAPLSSASIFPCAVAVHPRCLCSPKLIKLGEGAGGQECSAVGICRCPRGRHSPTALGTHLAASGAGRSNHCRPSIQEGAGNAGADDAWTEGAQERSGKRPPGGSGGGGGTALPAYAGRITRITRRQICMLFL